MYLSIPQWKNCRTIRLVPLHCLKITCNPTQCLRSLLYPVAGFSSVFMNQSFWQAGMAAKPGHAVWGFILAGLAYFAVPFAMALALGIGYWAISIRAGEHSLIDDHTLTGRMQLVVSSISECIGKYIELMWALFYFNC